MKIFKPDAWSGTHLFGSFFLARVLQLWLDPVMAFCAAVALGVLWECVDQIVRRSGDWGDVAFDALGAGMAIWI